MVSVIACCHIYAMSYNAVILSLLYFLLFKKKFTLENGSYFLVVCALGAVIRV